MSPQVSEDRLPAIPEEPLANDVNESLPVDQEVANTIALPENINSVLPPPSVPPVTMDENIQPPPPPYPEQAQVTRKNFYSQVTRKKFLFI